MRVRIRYIIYAVQSKLAAGYVPGSKCSIERLSERFLFGMKKSKKPYWKSPGVLIVKISGLSKVAQPFLYAWNRDVIQELQNYMLRIKRSHQRPNTC
jgi:hypothetical protein